MKKIDVSKSYEKVKVSLALDKEIIDLVDNSLIGFKLINLLSKEHDDIKNFMSVKNEPSYKSILNRSDFLVRILDVIKEEKLFAVNGTDYSLEELVLIGDEISFNSMFDFYIDLTQLFTPINLGKILNETVNEIRNLSLTETLEHLTKPFYLNLDKPLLYGTYEEAISGKQDEEDTIPWSQLDGMFFDIDSINTIFTLPLISLFSHHDSQEAGMPWSSVLQTKFGINKGEIIKDIETKLITRTNNIMNLHKKSYNLNEIYKTSDEMDFYARKNNYTWELHSDITNELKKTIIFIVKNLYNDIPDLLKVMILRNYLFGETHRYNVHIFEKYLECKFDIKNREKKEAVTYDETL